MILPDVNVVLYAYRSEALEHRLHAAWLNDLLRSGRTFAIAPQVLSSLVRIMTHRKAFGISYSTADVLQFCNALVTHPRCEIVQPGLRHWDIFCELCSTGNARGNRVPDAWFAALAIEHDCEWITHDRDYARFPGLRWRPPF